MNLHAGVNQFADIGPIFEVPRAAVDLVDDDSPDGSAPQQPQHLGESGAAFLRRAFPLLEPPDDL